MSRSEVYDLGYEKWEGQRTLHSPAWWLIAKNSLRNLIASSGCLVRSVFFIAYTIYFFLVLISSFLHYQYSTIMALPGFDFLKVFAESEAVRLSEADFQRHFVFYNSIVMGTLLMIIYGGQLIAKEKAANALQVYFSKAVTRADYVLGKYAAIGILLASLVLVPHAMMMLMGLALAPDFLIFIRNAWYLPFLFTGFWLLLVLSLGTVTLFFSSCFNKGFLAGVSIVGFLFFTKTITGLLGFILGERDFIEGFDWQNGIVNLGEAIFGVGMTSVSSTVWYGIDLSLICGLMFWLLLRNIRPVEVIS